MTIKITTTSTASWKEQCKKWAIEGEYFEVRGIKTRELAFCKELCAQFNYECNYNSADPHLSAVFSPIYI